MRPYLTVGSLFSGIGGFDLAARWMGWDTLWMVENNPFCRRVLRKHFPDAVLYGNIRRVDFETVEHVDMIVGGFPCQPHSSVNRKSHRLAHRHEDFLWPEFKRAIRLAQPKYAVVENVPNIIRDGTLEIILKDLAALGYDAEWDIISARAVGAPHLRERAWIIAYPGGFGIERFRPRKRPRKTAPEWTSRKNHLQAFAKAPFTRRGRIPQPLLRRMDDGFSSRVDRLRSVGNSVVPQVLFNFIYPHIARIERRLIR